MSGIGDWVRFAARPAFAVCGRCFFDFVLHRVAMAVLQTAWKAASGGFHHLCFLVHHFSCWIGRENFGERNQSFVKALVSVTYEKLSVSVGRLYGNFGSFCRFALRPLRWTDGVLSNQIMAADKRR
jgi:hypothetical protein